MADVLCGPSNALQSFQKHTAADRTLQQDRLTLRHSPTQVGTQKANMECIHIMGANSTVQGFRSSTGPDIGVVEAEFEAFQAGQPLEEVYPEPDLFQPVGAQSLHTPNVGQQSLPDWASDFQSLHLNNDSRVSPLPSSQYHQYAPMQRNTTTGWQHESMQYKNQPSKIYSGTAGFSSYSDGVIRGFQSPFSSSRAQEKQADQVAHAEYDEAAFERAFDLASSEFNQVESLSHDQGSPREQIISAQMDGKAETIRIGSDRILDEARETGQTGQDFDDANEADKLARTAGNLLENVEDDQSQKFRESNFLSLMRQLRDREVRVEGDKLVDVSIPISAS